MPIENIWKGETELGRWSEPSVNDIQVDQSDLLLLAWKLKLEASYSCNGWHQPRNTSSWQRLDADDCVMNNSPFRESVYAHPYRFNNHSSSIRFKSGGLEQTRPPASQQQQQLFKGLILWTLIEISGGDLFKIHTDRNQTNSSPSVVSSSLSCSRYLCTVGAAHPRLL